MGAPALVVLLVLSLAAEGPVQAEFPQVAPLRTALIQAYRQALFPLQAAPQAQGQARLLVLAVLPPQAQRQKMQKPGRP